MSEIPQFLERFPDLSGLRPQRFPDANLRSQVFPRIHYWEEFKRRLSGQFWKSSDITVGEDVVLKAGTKQKVPVILPLDLGPCVVLAGNSFRLLNLDKL